MFRYHRYVIIVIVCILFPMNSLGVVNAMDDPAINSNGRFIAYDISVNSGNRVYHRQVYRYDLEDKVTLCVSKTLTGNYGNGDSYSPLISMDGRYILYVSSATNLIGNDTNELPDLYLHDCITGATTIVNTSVELKQAMQPCLFRTMSDDGNMIGYYARSNVFTSSSRYNSVGNIFLFDRKTGNITTIVGDMTFRISQITGYLFVLARESILTGNGSGIIHLYRYDINRNIYKQIDISNAGVSGNSNCCVNYFGVSNENTTIAFASKATNLTTLSDNRYSNVYIHDMRINTTDLISSSYTGDESNGASGEYTVSCSGDGRYVIYDSQANNITQGDENNACDIFLYDKITGRNKLVSIDEHGKQFKGKHVVGPDAVISNDGKRILFKVFPILYLYDIENNISVPIRHNRNIK